MLVENQLVEVKWCNPTRKWYESKGYKFTKQNETFYVKVDDLQPTSTCKVKVVCDYCGENVLTGFGNYMKGTKNQTIKYACSKCGSKKQNELYHDKGKYYKIFCDMCYENGYIPISTEDEYVNAHTNLKFKCQTHGIQKTTYSSLSRGCGCNLCGFDLTAVKNRLSISDVIKAVESKNGNKLINPEEYVNAGTNNLKIKCGMCGKTFLSSLNSINASQGACYNCRIIKTANHLRYSPELVESIINSVNNNVLLNKDEYIGCNDTNLRIKCGCCGDVYNTSLALYTYANVNRCPKCSRRISKGEQKIINILKKYNISYVYQKTFNDCRDKLPLPFDFYIQEYNLCIEFDGMHHYKPIWGEDRFLTTKLHDAMKDNYCRWNDIDLLRISYLENKNLDIILESKLNIGEWKTNIGYNIKQKIKYIPNRKIA